MVPTRGPSAHLVRLLDRLAVLERAVVVVVDDPSERAADAVRAHVASLHGPARFAVVDAAARAGWREDLTRASGRADAVSAALVASPESPWRIGALRNQLLLQAAGRVVLSVDDDVLPDFVASPRAHEGWRLSAQVDPTEWWPVAQRADAWREATSGDPAALHEGVIGRRASSLLDARSERLGSDPALEAEVAGDARVVVSTFGLAGDAGASRASIWLGASPDARARALERFPDVYAARAMLRVAPRATITSSPWFMAPCFAMDARGILPPFLPEQRNTDGLWGMTLRRITRSGLIAHLPLAIRHDPSDDRRFEIGDLARDAVAFRVTDLLALWIAVDPPRGATPQERLRAFGAALGALSVASPAVRVKRVEEIARIWLRAVHSRVVAARREGGPQPWQDALADAESAVQRALVAPPWPCGSEGGRSPDDTLAALLGRYALCLDAWPELWAAAQTLGG